tara:strand:+ start:347 stop:589 length:243 start_codon:yes stop_codon:yes gene_type:complete
MSAHSKLNDDATGTGQNLDQVLYFGLQEQILEICKQRAAQFVKYGVTEKEVLDEIRCVLDPTIDELLNDTQSTQTRKERQ